MKFEFVRSVKICLTKENAHEFSTTGAMKSMTQSRVLKKQIPSHCVRSICQNSVRANVFVYLNYLTQSYKRGNRGANIITIKSQT